MQFSNVKNIENYRDNVKTKFQKQNGDENKQTQATGK